MESKLSEETCFVTIQFVLLLVQVNA